MARVSPTFTLLGLSTKPHARLELARVVRKITRWASPPWLDSTANRVRRPDLRCLWAVWRSP
eukprot:8980865-Pyramimonas_sp.AAC.1